MNHRLTAVLLLCTISLSAQAAGVGPSRSTVAPHAASAAVAVDCHSQPAISKAVIFGPIANLFAERIGSAIDAGAAKPVFWKKLWRKITERGVRGSWSWAF